MTAIATALVVVAQAAIAPASCCLLQTGLTGGGACCIAAAVEESASPQGCCHGSPAPAEAIEQRGSSPAVPSGECLLCSADPKVVPNDRIVPTDLATETALRPMTAIVPVAGGVAVGSVRSEAFHRTALASCAWLCVWLI